MNDNDYYEIHEEEYYASTIDIFLDMVTEECEEELIARNNEALFTN